MTETVSDLVGQLVAIRKAKGILQSTVARRMHVTRPAVCHLERGRYSPSLAVLTRYAAAIGARITVEDVQ
ncbi:hypothetical protein BST13_33235 [Mycobacterium aquaticum]|uniref:HTH cro/C1-type domain-containing protein n=1 Tax=Mycobacterium aquaticum TaxID=1927124 RepID=A0A1X0A543_9MYCO|nr:hypothetical protein BST13_33235 [Mycobacterium aquaticum]